MTESTLSCTLTDLRIAVAHYMGLGVTAANWSAADLIEIDRIIKKGLRQFYFPPQISANPPHQWNFLKPIVTLTTIAPYSTGTIALTVGDATVTLTDGVWPSWAYTHGSLVVNSVEYTIASRTNDTQIELSAVWAGDAETAAEYTLRHDGIYDLPDDFGGIEGRISYDVPNNYLADIVIVGEGKIRSLHGSSLTVSGSGFYPQYAAIRPKEHTATTTGQRFEILFWPVPSTAYTLNYKQVILPDALVASTLTHPYGGAMHAETIEASCIAMAEMASDEKSTVKFEYFKSRLSASIELDKRQSGIEYIGYNGDHSDDSCRCVPECRHTTGTCVIHYDKG